MKKTITFITLLLLFPVYMFSQEYTQEIVIDPSVRYQTIESFGASDCWSVKDIGSTWKDNIRTRVVKELFSTESDHEGNPEGIGLSMWRFNLGAGTENDEAIDASRRTESFLNDAGNGYDWSKQAGQQWFMDRAREYGCNDFVAFSNSPLVQYTKNGKGYANQGEPEANLQNDKYDDYAEYCADVMKHFQDQGKGFKYFSPVNEPQYAWNEPSQEGSPWQNENIKKFVVELDKAFQAKGVNTKLLIPEAGDWTYLYQSNPGKHGGRASNQIYEFFDPGSSNYVGNLPSMAPVIGGHSYWTTGTNSETKNIRVRVQNKAKEYDLSVFQTEYSMLSGGEGLPEDLGDSDFLTNALFLAKVIYSDMEHAQVTSWSYWTAFGIDQWGHKNRFLLISVVPGGGINGSMTASGTAEATKNLWALGNYSYFIRPGYQRIRTKNADDMAGLMCSSYIAPDSSRIVSVYVNMSTKEHKVKTTIQNLEGLTPVTNKRYVTDSFNNLYKYGSASSEIYEEGKILSIPSRSVTTIVYDLEKASSALQPLKAENFNVFPNPARCGSTVELELPGNAHDETGDLSMHSLNGMILCQEKLSLSGGMSRLTVPAGLSAGMYLLQINTRTCNYKSKLVIR